MTAVDPRDVGWAIGKLGRWHADFLDPAVMMVVVDGVEGVSRSRSQSCRRQDATRLLISRTCVPCHAISMVGKTGFLMDWVGVLPGAAQWWSMSMPLTSDACVSCVGLAARHCGH